MNAYDIMHEWDRVAGNPPRTDADLDRDIAGQIPGGDYDEWKRLLEAKNVPAITQGMRLWGIPVQPLGAFEMDDHIETAERPDLLS